MKKTVIVAGFASLLSTTAMAEGIGVSMALFDDNFLTVLRNGIQEQADAAGAEGPGGRSFGRRADVRQERDLDAVGGDGGQ